MFLVSSSKTFFLLNLSCKWNVKQISRTGDRNANVDGNTLGILVRHRRNVNDAVSVNNEKLNVLPQLYEIKVNFRQI